METLPNDIIIEIFTFLPVQSRFLFSQTCARCWRISSDERIWKYGADYLTEPTSRERVIQSIQALEILSWMFRYYDSVVGNFLMSGLPIHIPLEMTHVGPKRPCYTYLPTGMWQRIELLMAHRFDQFKMNTFWGDYRCARVVIRWCFQSIEFHFEETFQEMDVRKTKEDLWMCGEVRFDLEHRLIHMLLVRMSECGYHFHRNEIRSDLLEEAPILRFWGTTRNDSVKRYDEAVHKFQKQFKIVKREIREGGQKRKYVYCTSSDDESE